MLPLISRYFGVIAEKIVKMSAFSEPYSAICIH